MSGAAAMVERGLRKWGEDATFERFTGTSGSRVSGGSSAPSYGSAITVRAMPWTGKEEDLGGASVKSGRFMVGGAALVSSGVTEIRGQDRLTLGGVAYEVVSAEPVRSAGEILYFDVRTAVR